MEAFGSDVSIVSIVVIKLERTASNLHGGRGRE